MRQCHCPNIGWYVLGSHLGTSKNQYQLFKGSIGKCKATTLSSLSHITTNKNHRRKKQGARGALPTHPNPKTIDIKMFRHDLIISNPPPPVAGVFWCLWKPVREGEMFYLTTHSTHFIYGYMASDIWLRTILIVRKETRCCHIGYSYRLTARVLLYAPSHRQNNTYHSLCYTSRGALAGTRNSSMGPAHEGSIRRPIAPWANALPLSYVPLLKTSNWLC